MGSRPRRPFCRVRFFGAALVSVLGAWASSLSAAESAVAETSWSIFPAVVRLQGPGARQSLIVEKIAPSGEAVGAIEEGQLEWTTSDSSVVHIVHGVLIPQGNGTADVTVHLSKNRSSRTNSDSGTTSASDSDSASREDLANKIGPLLATCRVTVEGMERGSAEWEFRRHVLPVLSKAGCNSGACHGALAGKGGLRLSLRGYNPTADHSALTLEAKGRRIELSEPGSSLLLTKPSMVVAHKGGLRLEAESADYRLLAEWISAGAAGPSEKDAQLERLEVLPNRVTLQAGGDQPLVVRAFYSDGREEDVTRWAKFTATNENVAHVDQEGKIRVTGHGEGAVVVWFSSQIVLARVTVPFDQTVAAEHYTDSPRRNMIDSLVLDQLKRLNLAPSGRSSDLEFLRRLYLDTIGKLPSPEEVTQFLADPQVDKRDRLIDQLLSRDEYVDYWSYKWSDVLLVSSRRLRPAAVKSYYEWIREQVKNNRPWDEFVRDVLTATGEADRQGATNFYSLHQSPEEMMENACQSFLSLSIGCAKCHNHPLEKWTNDQYYGMASHFARVRAKGWGGDPRGGDGLRTIYVSQDGELVQPTRGVPQPPTPLDGQPLDPSAPGDRRQHLAKWLTGPSNPYFARSIANRVWANFFGVGLVNPVDDLRMSNPASNEPLLEGLADYLRDRKFDIKDLIRLIVMSETYQRTSQTLPENRDDHEFFSHYMPRRLTAEVLLDAIADVTEVPTEFTQIGFDGNDFQATDAFPKGTRALELSDSAVVSDFLRTFGRNERDITCECERSNTPSIVQVLHIHNGQTINQRLASAEGFLQKQIDQKLTPHEMVTRAFMKTLSRMPYDHELQPLTEMLATASEDERRTVLEDLYWSILSSREFLFNH